MHAAECRVYVPCQLMSLWNAAAARLIGSFELNLIDIIALSLSQLSCVLLSGTQQAETHKWFESLKLQVDKRDADIRQLQRSLKESEGLLASISLRF